MNSDEVRFSKHVFERMENRGISRKYIVKVLESPDSILDEEPCMKVYHKKFVEDENPYLIRVFLNDCKSPPLVITTYKTSKMDKYED